MKNLYRKLCSVFMCFLYLTVFLGPCALAAETLEDYVPKTDRNAALEKAQAFLSTIQGRTDQEIANEKGISVWDVCSPYGTSAPEDPQLRVTADQSWDDVVAMLLSKYGINEADMGTYSNISMGYYNTVTGEEHYYEGDKYLVSGSMFKVPLNMIMTDKLQNGEITWDTDIYGYNYGFYEYKTLVQSDNEKAVALFTYLGGYEGFKQQQVKYLGEGADPDADLGWSYHIENFYTARQICSSLKMVYNEPERFVGILENMLEAEPYSYFRQYERRYPIAHKYGFVEQNESTGKHTYINDCGVVFCDTPFIIVMFTDNINKAYDVLSEYSTLMTDYTQFRIAEKAEQDRLAEEEAEREKALEEAKKAEEEQTQQESAAAPVSAPGEDPFLMESEDQTEEFPAVISNTEGSFINLSDERFYGMSVGDLIIMVCVLACMLFCMVLIFRKNGSGRINGFWGVIAILFAGASVFCCVIGNRLGTLYAKVSDDPRETVKTFYESVLSGDYEKAYSCLIDYSSLGLDSMPSGTESRMLYEALKNSYGYALRGEPEINMLNATQKVAFKYLNLEAVERDAKKRVDGIVREFVETRPRSQLYDENGEYLTELTDEIYLTALTQAIDEAENYYTSAEYDVSLTYSDGKWLMSTCPEMLSAFLGGIS